MKIRHHLLHGSQSLHLPSNSFDSIHAVVCNGKGTRLQVPVGWISVTAVLHGSLELSNNDIPWPLAGRHIQVWLEGNLKHLSRSHSRWLCITAPAALWPNTPGHTRVKDILIPLQSPCLRELARPLIRLARAHRFQGDSGSIILDDALSWMHSALIEQQQPMQEQLARCSGRTASRRHQTLLRLLKVQHLIRCSVDDRIDLTRLAAIANYSPTHLIRVYRAVFGETPSEYAMRLRQQRAWDLVLTTELPVCEIAESLGFESESAFCRAFKHAFGCTTSEARRTKSSVMTSSVRPMIPQPQQQEQMPELALIG